MQEPLSNAQNSSNSFWCYVEKILELEIPDALKIILTKCGYDSFLSLKHIKETDLQQMEMYINSQCNVDELLNEIDSDKYFGQKVFEIIPGHKRFLLNLTKLLTDENVDQRFKKVEKKYHTQHMDRAKTNIIPIPMEMDVFECITKLLSLLNNWMAKAFADYEDFNDDRIEFEAVLEHVTIPHGMYCILQCPKCSARLKCTLKNNTWSNFAFQRHYRSHYDKFKRASMSDLMKTE